MRSRSGLTLVEILIFIAIIGILGILIWRSLGLG